MKVKAVFHRKPKMLKKTRTRITLQKKGKRKENKNKRKSVTVLEHDHAYDLCPIQEADSTAFEHKYENFFLDKKDTTFEPECLADEVLDSEGCSAQEFYVILDKVFRYYPSMDFDLFVQDRQCQIFMRLKEELQSADVGNYVRLPNPDTIRFIQTYDNVNAAIKICVNIFPNFRAVVKVHRISNKEDHTLWSDLPRYFFSPSSVLELLKTLDKFSVCVGNCATEYQRLVDRVVGLSHASSSGVDAYREQDFGYAVLLVSC